MITNNASRVPQLTDVSLQDSDPAQYDRRQNVERSRDFKMALEKQALRFAFLDGKVEGVCPETADPTWVVNIKRGILSALQNTQTRLDGSQLTVEVSGGKVMIDHGQGFPY